MRKALFRSALAATVLAACGQPPAANRSASAAVPPAPFAAGPLDSVYRSLRPAAQTFRIDNREAATIKAARGTELLLPAGCFVNADGEPVADAQVEVVEALSLPDFVTGGLATLSGGRLLLSNGMLYVNATAGGESLRLKPGSALTVSMTTMGPAAGFQMFRGDGRNWTPDSAMTETDYAVALPLRLLYPKGNDIFTKCVDDVGGPREKSYLLDTNIVNVSRPEYEGTVIATEEFGRRFDALWAMMEHMSYFSNREYYFDKTDCSGLRYNYDIWRIYFDHPQRSLRVSDSIARARYLAYFRDNREKIEAFCTAVNEHKRRFFSNWTDTNYYFDFRMHSLEEQFLSPLKRLPSDSKELLVVDTRGVDPAAPDAYAQLRAKGVSEEECNRILTYHFRKQGLVRALQRARDAEAGVLRVQEAYGSTVFSVQQLGWINCDRFYDDPAAGKASITVSNSSGQALDFIDCSLVIPSMNVRLSGFADGAGRWTFTKKDGPYTRLPLGQEAVVTGVSLRHDTVFFASQKIRIEDGVSVALAMKPLEKDGLKGALAAALKP